MGIENLDVLSDPNEDAAAEKTGPHPVEENAEELAGEVTKDPWADETQTDWPNNVTAPVEAPEEEV